MKDLFVRALKASSSILHSVANFIEVATLIVEEAMPDDVVLETSPSASSDAEGLTGEVHLTPEALDMLATKATPPEPTPDEPPLRGSLEERLQRRFRDRDMSRYS